jgi:hypothetical protein
MKIHFLVKVKLVFAVAGLQLFNKMTSGTQAARCSDTLVQNIIMNSVDLSCEKNFDMAPRRWKRIDCRC